MTSHFFSFWISVIQIQVNHPLISSSTYLGYLYQPSSTSVMAWSLTAGFSSWFSLLHFLSQQAVFGRIQCLATHDFVTKSFIFYVFTTTRIIEPQRTSKCVHIYPKVLVIHIFNLYAFESPRLWAVSF